MTRELLNIMKLRHFHEDMQKIVIVLKPKPSSVNDIAASGIEGNKKEKEVP